MGEDQDFLCQLPMWPGRVNKHLYQLLETDVLGRAKVLRENVREVATEAVAEQFQASLGRETFRIDKGLGVAKDHFC